MFKNLFKRSKPAAQCAIQNVMPRTFPYGSIEGGETQLTGKIGKREAFMDT